LLHPVFLSGGKKDDIFKVKRCNTCGGKKDKVKKTFKLYNVQHQFLEDMKKAFGVKDTSVSDLSRIPLPRPNPKTRPRKRWPVFTSSSFHHPLALIHVLAV
jgi:hypothetical protein